MRKLSLSLAAGLLGLAVLLLIAACSGKKAGSQAAAPTVNPAYANWLTFTYGNFRIHHPPNHPHDTLFQDDARIWSAIERQQARFFGMPVPPDTIDVMFYTGVGQGSGMTHHKHPFVHNDTVFFWLPNYYGPVIARYMIQRWHPQPTRFPFLHEGMVALLDFSGQNNHKLTLRNIDEHRFEPLARLAVDTTLNADSERVKSCEAASFVDFVNFRYGPKALAALYGAVVPFDSVVHGLFMISVDSLQTLWLQTARRGAALDTVGTKP